MPKPIDDYINHIWLKRICASLILMIIFTLGVIAALIVGEPSPIWISCLFIVGIVMAYGMADVTNFDNDQRSRSINNTWLYWIDIVLGITFVLLISIMLSLLFVSWMPFGLTIILLVFVYVCIIMYD